jgi:hypothetical protein
VSKNIVIQENGIGKQLTADKLKTNLVGGGTCLWVPEDETQLGTKYVSENGTYRASDDGYYGFSEFTVSGVGTATGKDGDGDKAQTTVDPTTGDLVTKKLIESIQVTTSPTKTTYQGGETLDFSGLVVHGYSSTGRDMGVIPLSQLSISPTSATYDPETASSTASSDLVENGINIAGYCYRKSEGSQTIYESTTSGADAYVTWIYNGSNLVILDASASSSAVSTTLDITTNKETGQITSQTSYANLTREYTHNGKKVYYIAGVTLGGASADVIQPSPTNIGSADDTAIAWTAIYGDITEKHSVQTITASYTNDAGTVLTATFTVNVTQGE